MVKARVTNMQKYLKPSFFDFTIFMVIFNLKKISIKSVFTSNLIFINPWNALFRLKPLKKLPLISLSWFGAQQQASTLSGQISRSTYSEFMEKLSEFTPSFQN